MKKDKNFRFQTNVSLDTYRTKKDAISCLSSKGAAAIGKNKMAFKQQSLSTDEFLTLATGGHTFCNLFMYDPTKKYWFQDKEGKWHYCYPEYQNGKNKGGMKLCMKRDEFFEGAQTVFVDIDYTKYDNIRDYVSTLTYQPTCVYMSYSDKQEKSGRVSRRFRLIYVFDKILTKTLFCQISQNISDQIVLDTCEPMDDDCGTRMSQYMNGVYGNNETYTTYNIYSTSDFPTESSNCEITNSISSDTQASSIIFDDKMLNDMGEYTTKDFFHYYSWKYPYQYRIEKPEWDDNIYQMTDDNYLQLWWYREKQFDGMHRRRKLFKNACLRRLMFPDMTSDAALYNLYLDFVRFFDNSDGVITLDCLIRKVKHAFSMTTDQLIAYCNWEIQYWKEHRPQFIIRPGIPCNLGLIAQIRQRIRWKELNSKYDTHLSVQQNIQNGIDVSLATLYRYCKANQINTNPNKKTTEAERREAKREEKKRKIEQFKLLYNPSVSVNENKQQMEEYGLKLSIGTIYKWANKYYEAPLLIEVTPLSFEKPTFRDFNLKVSDGLKMDNGVQVEDYSWWKLEDDMIRWC